MFDVIPIATVNWCLLKLPTFGGINMQRPKTFFSFMQKRHRHSSPFSFFETFLRLARHYSAFGGINMYSRLLLLLQYIRQFHEESDSSTAYCYCYCFPFFVLRNGTIWSLWLKCCNLDLLRNMQFGDLFDRWDGFGMFEHWNFDHKAVWRLEGCEDIFGEVFISF